MERFKEYSITLFEHLLLISAIISQTACSLEEISPEQSSAQPILNGQNYSGKELAAVGLLKITDAPLQSPKMFEGSEQICTGTLIGRRTVITAAHCIKNKYFKYFWLEDDTAYPVESAMYHPNHVSCKEDAQGNQYCNDIINVPYDLAIITLKYYPDLTKIKPLSLSSSAPAPYNNSGSFDKQNNQQGNTTSFKATGYHLVGYGLNGQWNGQQWEYYDKSQGTKRIADISNNLIYLSPSNTYFAIQAWDANSGLAASGDSGSPILNSSNRIVGIHSEGSSVDATTFEAQVNVAMDWIKRVSNNDVIIDGVYQGAQQNVNAPVIWTRKINEPCTAGNQCPTSAGLSCFLSNQLNPAKVGFCVKSCSNNWTGNQSQCPAPSTCTLANDGNRSSGLYFCTPLINQQVTGN